MPAGALQHGLAVLDLFSAEERGTRVGEMARQLRLHKSSASLLASTQSAAGPRVDVAAALSA